MSLIAAGEAIKPGSPVLDPVANNLLLDLYSRALAEMGSGKMFYEAWLSVIENHPFRPDISEIRRAAGLRPNAEALKELRKLITIMRVHWSQQSRKLITVWVKDANGNPTDEKATPPPLSAKTEATLLELGMGSREAGLLLIAGHPAISKDVEERYRVRNANEIEKRWVEEWR